MALWHQREEVLYINWVCFVLAASSICYLFARHALLASGRLKPDALYCGSCAEALLESVLRLLNGTAATPRPSAAERRADDKQIGAHERVVFYGNYGSLLMYGAFCVNEVLLQSACLQRLSYSCQSAIVLNGVLFLLAKSCMYLVFVARLHLGFQNSACAYSKRKIQGFYALVVGFTLPLTALSAAAVRGQRGADGKHWHFCDTSAHSVFYAVGLLFDLCFNALMVYCFSSALKKMLRNFAEHMDERHRKEDRNDNANLYLLSLKYTVLTTVAIVSTMAAWSLFAVTGIVALISFDCVVNCAAICLMTAKWHNAYVIICTPLLRCVTNLEFCPCGSVADAELVELVAEKRRVATLSRSSNGVKSRTDDIP